MCKQDIHVRETSVFIVKVMIDIGNKKANLIFEAVPPLDERLRSVTFHTIASFVSCICEFHQLLTRAAQLRPWLPARFSSTTSMSSGSTSRTATCPRPLPARCVPLLCYLFFFFTCKYCYPNESFFFTPHPDFFSSKHASFSLVDLLTSC